MLKIDFERGFDANPFPHTMSSCVDYLAIILYANELFTMNTMQRTYGIYIILVCKHNKYSSVYEERHTYNNIIYIFTHADFLFTAIIYVRKFCYVIFHKAILIKKERAQLKHTFTDTNTISIESLPLSPGALQAT